MHFRTPGLWLLIALATAAGTAEAAAADWKAGAAKVKITPRHLMWMSGYASRDHTAEGTLHDLWAKALVFEDPAGKRAALVTLDLVGIDRGLAIDVCAALGEKYHLERPQIALCTSHTHTGPVVKTNLASMYFLQADQERLVADYAAELKSNIVASVGQAIDNLAPAQLAWGKGKAGFAVNRRNNKEADVPRLVQEGGLQGPVDHEVAVLTATRPDGTLAAIVFSYACHATVLGFYQWSGDYPGFAQIELEQAHPGAAAMFVAGCGGDQNPLPRKTVEFARNYGHQLAAAVEETIARPLQPITGKLACGYQELPLAFDKLPTPAELEAESRSSNKYAAQRAKLLLAQIAGGQPLSQTYPYPIQFWRIGADLQFIALGGEVVVDYALRLKRELPGGGTWVAAYSNDVMAYIPSRRVLKEGGYEGGGAMVYYGLPAVWSEQVEDTVVRGVHDLIRKTPIADAGSPP